MKRAIPKDGSELREIEWSRRQALYLNYPRYHL